MVFMPAVSHRLQLPDQQAVMRGRNKTLRSEGMLAPQAEIPAERAALGE